MLRWRERENGKKCRTNLKTFVLISEKHGAAATFGAEYRARENVIKPAQQVEASNYVAEDMLDIESGGGGDDDDDG